VGTPSPSQPRKIARADAIQRLQAANLAIGPNTGGVFEVWLTRDGYPQNLFYAGSPDYYWEHEVADAVAAAKKAKI
jgi:hypothetical protein